MVEPGDIRATGIGISSPRAAAAQSTPAAADLCYPDFMEHIDAANAALLLGSVLIIRGHPVQPDRDALRRAHPAVFLGVGMLAGVDGPGGIRFSDYSFAYLVGFAGAGHHPVRRRAEHRFAAFTGALAPGDVLATLGVLDHRGGHRRGRRSCPWISTRPRDFCWAPSSASTDPAAVFFLLRSGGLQLKSRVGSTSKSNRASTIPFALFLTLARDRRGRLGRASTVSAHLALFARQAPIGGGLSASAAVSGWSGCSTASACRRGCIRCSWSRRRVLLFAGGEVRAARDFSPPISRDSSSATGRCARSPASCSLNEAVTWLAQIVMFLVLGLWSIRTGCSTSRAGARHCAGAHVRGAAARGVAVPRAVPLSLARYGVRELGRVCAARSASFSPPCRCWSGCRMPRSISTSRSSWCWCRSCCRAGPSRLVAREAASGAAARGGRASPASNSTCRASSTSRWWAIPSAPTAVPSPITTPAGLGAAGAGGARRPGAPAGRSARAGGRRLCLFSGAAAEGAPSRPRSSRRRRPRPCIWAANSPCTATLPSPPSTISIRSAPARTSASSPWPNCSPSASTPRPK